MAAAEGQCCHCTRSEVAAVGPVGMLNGFASTGFSGSTQLPVLHYTLNQSFRVHQERRCAIMFPANTCMGTLTHAESSHAVKGTPIGKKRQLLYDTSLNPVPLNVRLL